MAAMFQCMMQLGFTVVIWQHSEFDWYCQLSGSGSKFELAEIARTVLLQPGKCMM